MRKLNEKQKFIKENMQDIIMQPSERYYVDLYYARKMKELNEFLK